MNLATESVNAGAAGGRPRRQHPRKKRQRSLLLLFPPLEVTPRGGGRAGCAGAQVDRQLRSNDGRNGAGGRARAPARLGCCCFEREGGGNDHLHRWRSPEASPLSSLLPQSGKWMDDGHVRVRPVGTRTMNADVGCVIREETLPSSTFPPREGGGRRPLEKPRKIKVCRPADDTWSEVWLLRRRQTCQTDMEERVA